MKTALLSALALMLLLAFLRFAIHGVDAPTAMKIGFDGAITSLAPAYKAMLVLPFTAILMYLIMAFAMQSKHYRIVSRPAEEHEKPAIRNFLELLFFAIMLIFVAFQAFIFFAG